MKYILDVDTGIDDTFSIVYMCAQKELSLIGITTVYGNIDVEGATQNTLDLLHYFNQNHIPVYQGCTHARRDNTYEHLAGGIRFHGKNGIGNAVLTQSPNTKATKHAVDFLIESAEKYGKDLVIIASGPLTNLAKAIERNPKAMAGIGNLVLMGGAFSVPGNVSKFAEANIAQDDLSSKIVLGSSTPITMIGLDVTTRAIITKEDVAHWQSSAPELYQIVLYYLDAYKDAYPLWDGCALHDPLAVFAALNPNLITGPHVNLDVLTDQEQKGRTILNVDAYREGKSPNVKVALDADIEGFKKSLLGDIDALIARIS
ncbi:nucleoside hydrolase [Erysipelothrix rhusiopathiae]|nr:nucleoside hydrolase [Erysipelothrix rhusiopathiae]MDE8119860.1 nucleoside hydrolase [Erysipelothrix rhusiopathiae]MDE8123998.1 nucleoside hydrolase [Erysipelothrix rhusiopathiae]MDE8133063.1 nucleoside hydrolase [Erysipelothrix rhusiopathiae]MDE8147123.1 nucleoside hydrolase [Erysipelothrix rhusiopathiae]